MTDQDRWLDTESAAFGQALIDAGRAERPSDRALGRTLAAISAGATVATVAGKTGAAVLSASGTGAALTASSGPLTVAKSTAGALLGKWLVGGLVGGAVASATAIGVVEFSSDAPRVDTRSIAAVVEPVERPAPEAPSPPAEEHDADPSAAADPSVEPPQPSAEAAEPVRPKGPAKSRPLGAERSALDIAEEGPRAEPSAQSPLEEELALIDEARALIDSGNSQSALAKLREYSARFRKGGLGPEALFLELRAHERLGNTEVAHAAAEKILDRYPHGPHAARAREVLGR
jgi:TolA-binding protein